MVLGLFSKKRALERAIAKAANPLAHPEDRMSALEKLRDDGSDEALFALCKRFGFDYEKTIQDAQEKDWVVDVLVAKGEAALEPLKRYMKNARSLGFPLKALAMMTSQERALEAVDEILKNEEPGYTRDPKRRIDIIEWLAEWEELDNETVARRIAPYLADFDENVRFKTIRGLALKPAPLAASPLVEALLNPEEESARIKKEIAEVLAAGEMDLGERKREVEALCGEVLADFKVHRDKLARK